MICYGLPKVRGASVPKIRVLVVDDHETVRRGICALLRSDPDIEVTCDVADGVQAVRKAKEVQPDVIVLDITMPKMDGLKAAGRIRKVAPQTEIVFLSQHDSLESVRQALRAGGRGYVVKSDAPKELIAAVRTVSKKKRYVNARFAVDL